MLSSRRRGVGSRASTGEIQDYMGETGTQTASAKVLLSVHDQFNHNLMNTPGWGANLKNEELKKNPPLRPSGRSELSLRPAPQPLGSKCFEIRVRTSWTPCRNDFCDRGTACYQERESRKGYALSIALYNVACVCLLFIDSTSCQS